MLPVSRKCAEASMISLSSFLLLVFTLPQCFADQLSSALKNSSIISGQTTAIDHFESVAKSVTRETNDDSIQRNAARRLSAYTGQDCFVTPRCTNGAKDELGPEQICPSGYLSVSAAHSPRQAPGHTIHGNCKEGWYRHICCPIRAMPKNCEWTGSDGNFSCRGTCKSGQFELNTDGFRDVRGMDSCFFGKRSLCCDSAAPMNECFWSETQGPLAQNEDPACPDDYRLQTYRLETAQNHLSCPVKTRDGRRRNIYKSALCCPRGRGLHECEWSNHREVGSVAKSDQQRRCIPHGCKDGKIQLASALRTPPAPGPKSHGSCDAVTTEPGKSLHFLYCCALPVGDETMPSPLDDDSGVETLGHQRLVGAGSGEAESVASQNEQPSTKERQSGSYQPDMKQSEFSPEEESHGFVTLDGPPGSVDHSFSSVYTFVRQQRDMPTARQPLVTKNRTLVQSVFEHSEETLYVYCNHDSESDECKTIWLDEPEDTIIRLPPHVGEGPFARLVSLKPMSEKFELPGHHVEHRSVAALSGLVYEIKIDYDFHKIKPKRQGEEVHIRIDYTNLLGYWEEMATSQRMQKRNADGSPPKVTDWHERVSRAIDRDTNLRKRDEPVNVVVPMSNEHVSTKMEKRSIGRLIYWIPKVDMLRRLTLGALPLAWADIIPIFRERNGCAGTGSSADLQIDLETNLNMDLTYAYYFQGRLIPPGIPDVYTYLGMQPNIYLGLRMSGRSEMQYAGERKKIIDTFEYPWLGIKGLASIGPSLDIYGSVIGKLTLSGQARAGAQIKLGKTEMFWSKDVEANKKYEKVLGMESSPSVPHRNGLEPVLEADVQLDAALDITLQPEASFGMKVGGGFLTGGFALADAQLTGYVTGGISFQANSHVNSTTGDIDYTYGVHLFYNLGYKARAFIWGLLNWALEPREAFHPAKRVDIYGPMKGTIPRTVGTMNKATGPVAASTSLPKLAKRELLGQLRQNELVSRAPKTYSSLNPKRPFALPMLTYSVDTRKRPLFERFRTCPVKMNKNIRIPELRYNCDLLGPLQVFGNRNYSSAVVPGMCEAWRGLKGFPAVLTFSDDKARQAKRRAATCGKKDACKSQDRKYWVKTGRKVTTACGDAPPSSSEEGGDYVSASSKSQICVPAFQSAFWTANSCQRLMLNLVSNWGELEPMPSGKGRSHNWVRWDDSAKWTTAGTHGSNVQRATKYPNKMPQPDGMPRRPSSQVSWVFRRNYTWSAVDDASYGSSPLLAPRAASLPINPHGSTHPGQKGWESVLCAMNTFGQDRVYKWKDEYNAFCLREQSGYDSGGFQNVQRVARCRVVFAKAGQSWEIKSIEYAGSAEEDETFLGEPTTGDDLFGKSGAHGDAAGLKGMGKDKGSEAGPRKSRFSFTKLGTNIAKQVSAKKEAAKSVDSTKGGSS